MQMTSMTDQSIPLGFDQNLVLRTRPVVCCISGLYRIGEVEEEFKGNCERKHRQRLKTIVNRLVSREYYSRTGALRIWPGNNNEFCSMES